MSFIHSPRIVTNGLALYLDAGNRKSYPGSGATWYDLSGNGNHCVFVATPTFNSGTCGELVFDGATHYGVVTMNSTLNFSTEQTVTMIVNPSGSVSVSGRRNPWNQAYAGYGTWTWEGNSNPISIAQYFGDGGADNSPYVGYSSPSVSSYTYAMMTSTRNISYQTWYQNGIAATPTAHTYGALTTSTNNIWIGNGYAGFFKGTISLVMAYTRCLSVDEINQNFNAVRGRFGL